MWARVSPGAVACQACYEIMIFLLTASRERARLQPWLFWWPNRVRIGNLETEAIAGAAETPEEFIKRRDAAIKNWLDHSLTLATVKPLELEARNEVASILFPEPKKGTNRYHLNGGYAIKLDHKFNYKLGNDMLENGAKVSVKDQVDAALARIRGLGDRGMEIALNLIKWEPKLSETFYEKSLDLTQNVDAQAKAIIDEILTIKPATPTLSFETPKEKHYNTLFTTTMINT